MRAFEGKVALVVGETSGIGRATAVAFAREGAKVVVAGRRESEGEDTVRLILETGSKGIFVRTDVKMESEVEDLIHKTVVTYGRLDFAFNNAGTLGGGALGQQTRGHRFDQVHGLGGGQTRDSRECHLSCGDRRSDGRVIHDLFRAYQGTNGGCCPAWTHWKAGRCGRSGALYCARARPRSLPAQCSRCTEAIQRNRRRWEGRSRRKVY